MTMQMYILNLFFGVAFLVWAIYFFGLAGAVGAIFVSVVYAKLYPSEDLRSKIERITAKN